MPSGNIVSRVYTPVLEKHSKSFSLIDCISVGVDRMQRNFEPLRKQVEAWQGSELTDVTANVAIYELSWSASWKRQNILPPRCTTSTSNRNTRNSSPGQYGVCRVPSHQHSRNWIPFHNLRRRRTWASSWKRDSRSRSRRTWRCRPGCHSLLSKIGIVARD